MKTKRKHPPKRTAKMKPWQNAKCWLVCAVTYHESYGDSDTITVCEHVPLLVFMSKQRAERSASNYGGKAVVKEMELVL